MRIRPPIGCNGRCEARVLAALRSVFRLKHQLIAQLPAVQRRQPHFNGKYWLIYSRPQMRKCW